MKTELIETGNLSSQLTIVLEPSDYKSKYDQEIKKYREKAHIKGFRKGKTPLSAVKKMYGRSVLAEVINDKLQSCLSDYIADNEIEILGNPLPSDSQQMVDFNIKSMGDYKFVFDLGMAPKFDVLGAGTSDEYTDYKVSIGPGSIEEELGNLQKRMGTQEEIDAEIETSDIVSVEINEILSEDLEREPFTTTITVMPDRLTEEALPLISGKRLGEEFDFNVFRFEKDATEEYVRKYFLKDAPSDVSGDFKGIVAAIKRLVPAPIDQTLFDKAFGEGKVNSEEEAKEFLKKELEDFYNAQGRSITKRYILENLIEKNELQFPDEFLKKWLLSTNDKLNEEEIDNDYEGFKKNLKWTLIKQNIAKANEIVVGPEDIKQALRVKIEQQFAQYGGYPGINYDDMVNRMMQNQETIQKEYEEILAERILDKVCDIVTLSDKNVTIEEYKEIVKDLQENIA